MAKTTDFELPNFRELMEQHIADTKGTEKKIPRLEIMADELTCHVFVNATIAILEVMGQQKETIMHMNDRMQVKDFPIEAAGEVMEELGDMAGFPITEETFIWQIAKAISTGETPKFKPRSH